MKNKSTIKDDILMGEHVYSFNNKNREIVIHNPTTPAPWINYLTNRRLSAFISQNAGVLLWHIEPLTRRITRYHYLSPPFDRPGFYVYVRNLTQILHLKRALMFHLVNIG